MLGEIEIALNKNGLIKIRFETDRKNIGSMCCEISQKTSCEYVGGVGKVGIFFSRYASRREDLELLLCLPSLQLMLDPLLNKECLNIVLLRNSS